MGIGVIDIDNHECMTLGPIQTPDTKTLDNMDKSLVDWYSCYLTKHKNQLQSISNIVVADAFFLKKPLLHLCVIMVLILLADLETMLHSFILLLINLKKDVAIQSGTMELLILNT